MVLEGQEEDHNKHLYNDTTLLPSHTTLNQSPMKTIPEEDD